MIFSPRKVAAPMLNWQYRFDNQGEMFFGSRRQDKAKSKDEPPPPPRAHEGVDLAAAPGTEVISPIYGVVDQVYPLHVSGKNIVSVVRIKGAGDHEGLVARLLYIVPDRLKAGDRVAVGERIGTLGYMQPFYPAGTTNHLHFEIHVPGDLNWRLKIIDEDRATRRTLYGDVPKPENRSKAAPLHRPNPYAVDALKFALVPEP